MRKKSTDLKHSRSSKIIQSAFWQEVPLTAEHCGVGISIVPKPSLFWVPAHPQHPPCQRIAGIAGNRIRPPSSQRVPRSLPPSSPTHPTITGRHIFRETSVIVWLVVSTLPPEKCEKNDGVKVRLDHHPNYWEK